MHAVVLSKCTNRHDSASCVFLTWSLIHSWWNLKNREPTRAQKDQLCTWSPMHSWWNLKNLWTDTLRKRTRCAAQHALHQLCSSSWRNTQTWSSRYRNSISKRTHAQHSPCLSHAKTTPIKIKISIPPFWFHRRRRRHHHFQTLVPLYNGTSLASLG